MEAAAPPRAKKARGDGLSGGVDYISGLPDAILGEIVSLLSTKEAARTQILASRWRHVWQTAPLVLDAEDLAAGIRIHSAAADLALTSVVSFILSTHPGPGRRFCIPAQYLDDRHATVDAWLRSPALDNLQELDFIYHYDIDNKQRQPFRPAPPPPPPASTFRFSPTLRVVTFSKCRLPDSSVQGLHFPHLNQLALDHVGISEISLHTMISSCPVLECLLLDHNYGFGCVRISSSSLRSIGLHSHLCDDKTQTQLRELIVVDAPCLERLLFLEQCVQINVSVIAAPKLEALGCLFWPDLSTVMFDTTIIEGSLVTKLEKVVRNVKILAVAAWPTDLDMVIDLLKCFPCLEKLYIKTEILGKMNRWRRKHRQFIRCFDIRLKTIVLQKYRGTRADINFISFFVLNATKLELMTLPVENRAADEQAFFTEQERLLQWNERASRSARLHFPTCKRCRRDTHVNHVRDLAIADPFECRCRH